MRVDYVLRRAYAALALLMIAGAVLAATADGRTMVGKSSWFGGPCDGMSGPITFTQLPMFDGRGAVPGVAIFDRSLMRRPVLLTDTVTHRRTVARVIDLGPAPWTDRVVDLLPGAAVGLGHHASPPAWCVSGYPTDRVLRVTVLSKKRARSWAARTKTGIDDGRF